MTSPIRLDTGTWIVVADGEKALFLENAGDAQDYNFQIRRIEEHENPPNRDQTASAPGRRSDGVSGHKSSMEETDWHQLEKDRFARELADILYLQAHRGRFDRLVIVAGPHVLGEMRGHLHKEVRDKVIAEIPKTLTGQPLDAIERSVRADLAKG